MPIPPEIVEALPATIEEIQGAGRSANLLKEAYEKFRNAFDYVNALWPFRGNLSRKEIGMLYRIGRYFSNQGEFLSRADENIPLDRRLAREVPVSAELYDASRQYRYHVQVEIYIKRYDVTYRYDQWVNSRHELTRAGVFERALSAINDRYSARGSPKVGDDDEKVSLTSIRLTGFDRLTMEVR